ncbi:PadR family transcriptional regulator [Saccharothrix algeriensis]|uniref:PadR family transcriptional regulator n=1 Tax=Saccharothrix algeriensis TaxID=173560 RepID=A0A8T8I048_9PSEU|nr:PadR family transcriptional regulator [Saccharothrix algeriensis]MBM7809776.1 PadR family transcriptional regulator PadR [Saccharothrix algeriensis]QTR04051.1 PadR family transcriptional regulator [Saccharothrix algeriensis]
MSDGRDPLTQMRRGVVEYCVLALLGQRERYAVELVSVLGRHGLIGGEGTIYPLLSRLRRQGLVETTWQESATGPPRRYYRISPQGAAAVERFARDWTALSESVREIMTGEGDRA